MTVQDPYVISITRNRDDSLICDPEGKHVKDGQHVTWRPESGKNVDNWAVVFGPSAPVEPKVVHAGGTETVEIKANRDFDPHKHKYVVLVWNNEAGIECHDPELIVDG